MAVCGDMATGKAYAETTKIEFWYGKTYSDEDGADGNIVEWPAGDYEERLMSTWADDKLPNIRFWYRGKFAEITVPVYNRLRSISAVSAKEGKVPVLNGFDIVYHRRDGWAELQDKIIVSATYTSTYDTSLTAIRKDLMEDFKAGRLRGSADEDGTLAGGGGDPYDPYILPPYLAYRSNNVGEWDGPNKIPDDDDIISTNTTNGYDNSQAYINNKDKTVKAYIYFTANGGRGPDEMVNAQSRNTTINIGMENYPMPDRDQ